MTLIELLLFPWLMLVGTQGPSHMPQEQRPQAQSSQASTMQSQAQGAVHIVDLGHPLRESDPSWTGEKVFTHTTTGKPGSNDFYLGQFASEEHFGTHLDAPAHLGGTLTVDKIPVDRLMRPGVCINVAAKAQADDDYRLTLADVRAFEQANGPIPEGAIVLVATGWDRRWNEPARYRNERDGVMHFPGLSGEAAAYFANERHVSGIGIDTPSVDYGASTDYVVHRTTHARNIFHVENATGLTALPPRGFTVIAAPLNIADGSGAPTRLFALLPTSAAAGGGQPGPQ
jgi:kynurenine formamidase